MNKIELIPDERKKILKNPDLILLDKELLLALLKDSDFPDDENLVDIRNVFLKKLRDKVEKLKTTNSRIIRHAYENQLGIKKIHKCCLATIETKDIESLFRFLCSKATEILSVDKIKIVVSEDIFSHSDIGNCVLKPNGEVSKFLEKSGITNGKPVRLKNVSEKKKITHEDIITREENTKSEAIISLLIERELKGFIFFESASESTFSVDQSTDYLEFFAKIASKHLESLLYK